MSARSVCAVWVVVGVVGREQLGLKEDLLQYVRHVVVIVESSGSLLKLMR